MVVKPFDPVSDSRLFGERIPESGDRREPPFPSLRFTLFVFFFFCFFYVFFWAAYCLRSPMISDMGQCLTLSPPVQSGYQRIVTSRTISFLPPFSSMRLRETPFKTMDVHGFDGLAFLPSRAPVRAADPAFRPYRGSALAMYRLCTVTFAPLPPLSP